MLKDSFTILLYHGIDSGEDFYSSLDPHTKEYILDRKLFEEHIDHLSKNGYNVAPCGECVKHAGSGNIPEKTVVLTFDDGEESCYTTVMPILDKFNFKGEFFITSGLIGRKNYMNAEELKNLSRAGHGVQSHSVSHPFLTKLDSAAIYDELKRSKDEIESLTGKSVDFFSIPTASHDRRVIDMALKAGYKAVLSSEEGYNYPGRNEFFLKRFAMRFYTATKDLATICGDKAAMSRKIFYKNIFTKSLKCMLTFELYDRIRDRVIAQKR